MRDTKELWNMPIVFLLLAGCRSPSGCCAANGVWYEARSAQVAVMTAHVLRCSTLRARGRTT